MRKRKISRNRGIVIGLSILFVVIYFSYAFYLRFSMREKYNHAIEEYTNGDYQKASEEFKAIINYQDSKDYYEKAIEEIDNNEKYQKALDYDSDGKYDQAIALLEELGKYNESDKKIEEIQNKRYSAAFSQAVRHFNQGLYQTALVEFKVLCNYRDDIDEYISMCYEGIRRNLATTVSAGSMYSIALGNYNKIEFTGHNDEGQGDLKDGDYISLAAGGYYTLGLLPNGDVTIAGDNPWLDGEPHCNWKNVVQVVSGFDFCAVLFEDGTVDYQGENSPEIYDEILDFSEWNQIVMIDAGYHMVVGLDVDGRVYVTGRNSSSVNDAIAEHSEDWENIVAVATGGTSKESEGFVVGLRADGTVITAGKTENGVIGAENWSHIRKISAGDYHLVGIKDDGEVIAVYNDNPDDDTTGKETCCNFYDWPDNIVDISAGNGFTLGLSSDGTVYGSGYDKQEQRPKSGAWTDIVVWE